MGPDGHYRFAQTDTRRSACQVIGQDHVPNMEQLLDGQPGNIRGEVSRGDIVQTHAVLQVADGILDPGAAATACRQFRVSPYRSVMQA